MPTAIVIGGGPAGSVAGYLLARAGWGVTLFESHSFPRDKVCGECLSGLGIEVLKRSGLSAVVESLGPAVLTRSLLHPGEGPTIEVDLPRPSWGVTRLRMDEALLKAAAAAGVTVLQPARVESIGVDPVVRWRDLTSNEIAAASADYVIVADGKGVRRKPTGDLGVKARFELVDAPTDAIELFAGPGCYGGLAAVEGGRWNAAFGVPAAMVKGRRGDLSSVIENVRRFNLCFARRMAGARQVSEWIASPLPRYKVSAGTGRVIAVGNAAAALEPVGGEGMGLAMRSAEILSQHLLGALGLKKLEADYCRLWNVRRAMCRGLGRIFSIPRLSTAAALLLSPVSDLPRQLARAVGK